MPNPRRTGRRLGLAVARPLCLAIGMAVPASAQSPLKVSFADGGALTFYGQLNFGYLDYDDGEEHTNELVSNDNSPTRFGLTYETDLGASWSLLARGEIGYQPLSSDGIGQGDNDPNWQVFRRRGIRKVELVFSSDDHGSLSLGQGSMATDGIAEIDLSGTAVIGYAYVPEAGGGFSYRDEDGALSDVSVADAATDLDGGRRLRLRYDSPTFSSVTLSGAYGKEVVSYDNDNEYADLAIRYERTFGDVKVSTGAGYNWVTTGSGDSYAASASALHQGSGLNLTLAGGKRQGDGGHYGYAKLGLIRDIWPIGSTAVAVDAYRGEGFARRDSTARSYAVMAVQSVDAANLDLYATYRVHEYDEDATDYRDGDVVFAGLQWTF